MRLDPHSYADVDQPRTSRLDLDLRVSFAERRLRGEAALTFEQPASGPLDLDTRDLTIEQVSDLGGRPLPFTLHQAEPILGARLRVQLPPQTAGVRVRYATSPEASALQWLEPAQTAGGKQPYLFSQCQAIHARSVVPLQDSPRFRIPFGAQLTVPEHLRALVAAAPLGRVRAGPGEATDRFEMQQPIPPYLIAFAVGDLASRALSPRCAVWSEPSVVERAAWEFAEVESIMRAAESLFGPYDWERFDLLVMPPSFPYGGMENPRLTFLTPSLLAGDRSLVNVIAHELAHAWTGNLVTNASADDFWLNEGFTVYAERRILEALHGKDAAELHASIGRHDLVVALGRFAARPELTRLRNDLWGVDPDVAYSTVPYEKGYLFLRYLEETVGRPAFDKFLRALLGTHRFQSVDTSEFINTVERELPQLLIRSAGGKLAPWAAEWIDGHGLPESAARPSSPRLLELRAMAAAIGNDQLPPKDLTPGELLLVLQALPAELTAAQCSALDTHLGLRARRSLEIRCAYLGAALRAGVQDAPELARGVVYECGRMKFLRPMYGALAAKAETKALAKSFFAELKGRYHPIAQAVIEGMLKA